uniref:Stress enhanced protein 1 n=1 Tax=Setaria italica TaxID=4555 RepID=K3YZR4_SETIT
MGKAHPLLSSASPRLRLTSAAGSRRNARSRALSVRCEQGAKGGGGGGLDVWLSRGGMLGFMGVVAVELTTGKGVLQNVSLTAPLPTVALGLTGVVGIFTAFIIFQSGSQD